MATVTKAADRNTVVTTGFTSPSNAYSATGDNTYATMALAKNATTLTANRGKFGFPGLTEAELPTGSTVGAVRLVFEWGITAAVTGGTVGSRVVAGGVAQTETTKTTTTEASLTLTPLVLPTVVQLQTAGYLEVEFGAWKGNTNTAANLNVDFVRLEVDFTAPPPSKSGTGTIAATGTASSTGTKTGKSTAQVTAAATPTSTGGKTSTSGTGAAAASATASSTGKKAASGVVATTGSAIVSSSGTKAGQGTAAVPLAATVTSTGLHTGLREASIATTAVVDSTGRKAGAGTAALSASADVWGTGTGISTEPPPASPPLVGGGGPQLRYRPRQRNILALPPPVHEVDGVGRVAGRASCAGAGTSRRIGAATLHTTPTVRVAGVGAGPTDITARQRDEDELLILELF